MKIEIAAVWKPAALLALCLAGCDVPERVAGQGQGADSAQTPTAAPLCPVYRTVKDYTMHNYRTFEYGMPVYSGGNFSISVTPHDARLEPIIAAFYKDNPSDLRNDRITAVGMAGGAAGQKAELKWKNNTGATRNVIFVVFNKTRPNGGSASLSAISAKSISTFPYVLMKTYQSQSIWVRGEAVYANNVYPGCTYCALGDSSEFSLATTSNYTDDGGRLRAEGLNNVALVALNSSGKGVYFRGRLDGLNPRAGSSSWWQRTTFTPGGFPNFVMTYYPDNPEEIGNPNEKNLNVVQRSQFLLGPCPTGLP